MNQYRVVDVHKIVYTVYAEKLDLFPSGAVAFFNSMGPPVALFTNPASVVITAINVDLSLPTQMLDEDNKEGNSDDT